MDKSEPPLPHDIQLVVRLIEESGVVYDTHRHQPPTSVFPKGGYYVWFKIPTKLTSVLVFLTDEGLEVEANARETAQRDYHIMPYADPEFGPKAVSYIRRLWG
jgi:hypothetical protein